MATKCRVYVDFDYIGEGMGGSAMGQSQSNNPGVGQGLTPATVGSAQTMRFQVSEQVLGTDGSLTLAQISTMLTQIAADIAGASGTPIITPAILATINGWNTGNP